MQETDNKPTCKIVLMVMNPKFDIIQLDFRWKFISIQHLFQREHFYTGIKFHLSILPHVHIQNNLRIM